MTKDLANLFKVLRTIDDINTDIDKLRRYIDFEPNDPYEEDAQGAYKNSLGRLLTIRHALEKKREKLESS